MDLNDIWQEHKRFILTVAVGCLVFLIANLTVTSIYEGDLTSANARSVSTRRELAKPLFGPRDRTRAQEQNDGLREALDELRERVAFRPRQEFLLDPDGGAESIQYQRIASRVRDDLLPRAARANLALEDTLGLPALSPTEAYKIERYLEALDVVERSVRLAIDSGVARVDDIAIKLDPSLLSREGTGTVERTKISFEMVGPSLAMTRFLNATQRADTAALMIHEFELTAKRPEETRLTLVLVVARVGDALVQLEEDGA